MSCRRRFGSFCQAAARRSPDTGGRLCRKRLQSGSVQDRRQRVGHGLADERSLSRQHLEEDAPEGPDVGPLVHGFSARLLRAHVRRRPDDRRPRASRDRDRRRVAACLRRRSHGLGQPEVQHLDRPAGVTFTLAGFRSRWMMPLLVRGLQRLGDLPRDLERLVDRHPAVPRAVPPGSRPPPAPWPGTPHPPRPRPDRARSRCSGWFSEPSTLASRSNRPSHTGIRAYAGRQHLDRGHRPRVVRAPGRPVPSRPPPKGPGPRTRRRETRARAAWLV